MKKPRYSFFIGGLLSLLLLAGCGQTFDAHLLPGKWEKVDWKIENTDQKINKKLDFYFDGRRYEVDYGPKIEKGKYWITDEYLHTVEDGKSMKKVKLVTLTKDTLVFKMNRAGRIEIVTLVKQH